MDFEIPPEIARKLEELDDFIAREIAPLEAEHPQYFDHRREHARTDWENGGRPRPEWEALLREMRTRADAAGHLRYGLPKDLGGQDGSNLAMAVIREHLAAKGLGLHNDLQNESSIIGNFPDRADDGALRLSRGSRRHWIPRRCMITVQAPHRLRPDRTATTAPTRRGWRPPPSRDGDELGHSTGRSTGTPGLHHATHDFIFARTSRQPRRGSTGITCFIVPVDDPRLRRRGVHVVDVQHADRSRPRDGSTERAGARNDDGPR